MRTYKTEGVILGRINFGEADRLLTIYSRHFGKIKVLAKGVRRTTSKKGGNLELFNWVRIFLAKGKNLDIITEVEEVETFRLWRKSLPRIGCAYHLCELVERLSAEQVINRKVFELLTQNLKDLENPQYSSLQIKTFETQLLEELGFWPRGKSVENVNLEAYIESLIEKKLRSKKIFNNLPSS